jgi:simple sugar transport system permease protein
MRTTSPLQNTPLLNTGAFFLSLCLTLLVGAFVLWANGTPIANTYVHLFAGSIGSVSGIEASLVYATEIAFTALAASIAFRARVWNIGGEGQLMIGAVGASFAALYLEVPGVPLLLLVIICGMACSAVWALIPALLKVWLNVSEVFSSLMLNYVAVLWVDYLVFGPWRDTSMGGFPYTRSFPENALLPVLGHTEVHYGTILAVACAITLFVLFRRSRWGFETAVIGYSEAAAKYAGMSSARITCEVMLLSGAVAGLAGVCVVAGPAGRLYTLEQGYGYVGILVSWLAGHNPLLVLVMAVFYGVLLQGGATLQIAGVEPSLVLILQATMILFALASLTFVRYSGKILGKRKPRGITPSHVRVFPPKWNQDRSELSPPFAPDLIIRYKRYWQRLLAGDRRP